MIDLTPLDVRKKKEDFKRAVRGYDTAQVDSFLDLAAERLEELVGEERRLADRMTSLEDQLARYQERERALNEALLAAQELREEARSQAERDASLRLREAETHAEAILLDADQAIRHSQRRLEDLQARRGHLLRSYRNLIDRFGEFIDLEEARLDAEPEDLKDLLQRLEGDLTSDEETSSEPAPDAGGLAHEDAEAESHGAAEEDETAADQGMAEPAVEDVEEAEAELSHAEEAAPDEDSEEGFRSNPYGEVA